MPNVTLKDVADHVGVNVATVSRALSPDKHSLVSRDTRLRVVEAAETLGYRGNQQASALRKGRTGIVGVVVADISNPFLGPALRGISGGLGKQGLMPIIVETRDSAGELLRVCDKLLAQRVDGIICTAGRRDDQASLKQLAKEVPTVLAVRQWPNSGITSVSDDDQLGGRLAAEHLLRLGHTRFAQLVGPQDIGSFVGRTRGFSDALADAGATCTVVDSEMRLPTFDSGRASMDKLLTQHKAETPLAVFAQNDSIAIGALHLATELGLRCPDDISIVGYNDVPLTAHVTPPLTTVKLPSFEMGQLAAQLVAALIEDPEQSISTVTLAPELIVRESTMTL